MTGSRNAILLPKLFPTSQVKLGQFNPKSLDPAVKPYVSAKLAELEESAVDSADPEEPYKAFVVLDNTGHMGFSLIHLLGASFGAKSAHLLFIEAKSLTYKFLKNADELFMQICDDPKTKTWVREVLEVQNYFYFVVGIQVLKDANVTRVELSKMDASGHFKIPKEITQSVPIKFDANASHLGLGLADVLTSGILGIELRRVEIIKEKPKTGKGDSPINSNNVNTAKLKVDKEWVWAHERFKGDAGEEEKQVLRLGLGGFFPSPEELKLLETEGSIHEALE